MRLSRRQNLVLLASLLLIGAVALRVMREPPRVPPVSVPGTSLMCFRAGGELNYCRCLDRLEAARKETGKLPPPLPPLHHPAVKYATRYHRLYPVITGDTPRCLTPPAPPGPGVQA